MAAVPTRQQYFERWSVLHGGFDPSGSPLVGGWLRVVYLCARPFAALRVPPDLVTMLGLAASGLGVWLAWLGGRWVLLAVLLVVVSGLLDGLDGAVAVLTDRATRWGHVLDSLVDRCSDGLYLVALWLVGAPAGVCVAGGAAALLLEYARARAGAGGMSEVGVVTVAERPDAGRHHGGLPARVPASTSRTRRAGRRRSVGLARGLRRSGSCSSSSSSDVASPQIPRADRWAPTSTSPCSVGAAVVLVGVLAVRVSARLGLPGLLLYLGLGLAPRRGRRRASGSTTPPSPRDLGLVPSSSSSPRAA